MPNLSNPIVEIISASRCCNCLDTGLTATLLGIRQCEHCHREKRCFEPQALRLAISVHEQQERGQKVDVPLFNLARFLTKATSERPLMIKELRHYFGFCDDRTVKDMARRLRREWLLPIGASRQLPYGLYWINSPKDFLDWGRPFRSQAIDEIATYFRLLKRNFPELAGQQNLFLEQIEDELQEALR
jgi:hypothetical protein